MPVTQCKYCMYVCKFVIVESRTNNNNNNREYIDLKG